MRIAFYAPLKAPTHETPSGDRRMARLLQAALRAAGHEATLAADFRSFDRDGDPARQARLKDEGAAIAADLIAGYRASATPPEAWFTYHLYHKAPDWLGPAVAKALAMPYLVAEPSFAPKRAGGPWDLGHQAAATAIAAADRLFCLTRLDMACIAPLLPDAGRMSFLPPFLDAAPFAAARPRRDALARRFGLDPDRRWLLAVGMMRPGDKWQSFQRLGAAMTRLDGAGWQLLVVGDGELRAEVEAVLPGACFAGALPAAELADVYASCDLYVWPAVGEAYGMALLEAQATGLPVVAGNERGVPDVVRDGETGLLTPPGDMAAFGDAIAGLLRDDDRRTAMGRAAAAFVRRERTVAAAATQLDAGLRAVAP